MLELLYRSSIACILSCYVISYYLFIIQVHTNMTSSSKNDYDKTGFTYITSKLLPRWSLYTRYEYIANVLFIAYYCIKCILMVLVHSPHIDAAYRLVLANCYVFLTLYVLSYVLSLYVFIIICYYRYIIYQLNSKLCNSFNFITANKQSKLFTYWW